MSGKRDSQVAKALIGHSRIGLCHDLFGGERLCFQIFAGKYKVAYPGNVFQCIGVGVVVGASRPDGFFVQLYLLRGGRAVYHGSQTPVP